MFYKQKVLYCVFMSNYYFTSSKHLIHSLKFCRRNNRFPVYYRSQAGLEKKKINAASNKHIFDICNIFTFIHFFQGPIDLPSLISVSGLLDSNRPSGPSEILACKCLPQQKKMVLWGLW